MDGLERHNSLCSYRKGSLDVLFLSILLETEAPYTLMLSFVSEDYVKMKGMMRSSLLPSGHFQ